MAMRLFLVYVLVELAVVVGLASTIGFGWTVLLLFGTFALGLRWPARRSSARSNDFGQGWPRRAAPCPTVSWSRWGPS